jgi:hypothetical protein
MELNVRSTNAACVTTQLPLSRKKLANSVTTARAPIDASHSHILIANWLPIDSASSFFLSSSSFLRRTTTIHSLRWIDRAHATATKTIPRGRWSRRKIETDHCYPVSVSSHCWLLCLRFFRILRQSILYAGRSAAVCCFVASPFNCKTRWLVLDDRKDGSKLNSCFFLSSAF